MIRRVVQNALLMFFSIAMTLIAIDLVARYFVVRPILYPVSRHYYAVDPDTGHDIKPDVREAKLCTYDGDVFDISSNALGCFDHPLTPQGEYLLVVGDSFSWSYVDFDARWSNLLEEAIGTRVVNCSVAGTGTRAQFDKAIKTIEKIGHKPTTLIVGYYFGNDVTEDYLFPQRTVIEGYVVNQRLLSRADGSIVFRPRQELAAIYSEKQREEAERLAHAQSSLPRSIKHWLKNHSAIYYLLQENEHMRRYLSRFGLVGDAQVRPTAGGSDEEPLLRHSHAPLLYASEAHSWIEAAWRKHVQSFMLFKSYAQTQAIDLVVVLIPSREQIYQYYRDDEVRDYAKPVKRVTDFLTRNGIVYIDLHQAALGAIGPRHDALGHRDGDYYYAKDPHWNQYGHAFAAREIAKFIEVRRARVGKAE